LKGRYNECTPRLAAGTFRLAFHRLGDLKVFTNLSGEKVVDLSMAGKGRCLADIPVDIDAVTTPNVTPADG